MPISGDDGKHVYRFFQLPEIKNKEDLHYRDEQERNNGEEKGYRFKLFDAKTPTKTGKEENPLADSGHPVVSRYGHAPIGVMKSICNDFAFQVSSP